MRTHSLLNDDGFPSCGRLEQPSPIPQSSAKRLAVRAQGVFTSVADLKRKLLRNIRQYNKQPKPVKWKYIAPTRLITYGSMVTGH